MWAESKKGWGRERHREGGGGRGEFSQLVIMSHTNLVLNNNCTIINHQISKRLRHEYAAICMLTTAQQLCTFCSACPLNRGHDEQKRDQSDPREAKLVSAEAQPNLETLLNPALVLSVNRYAGTELVETNKTVLIRKRCFQWTTLPQCFCQQTRFTVILWWATTLKQLPALMLWLICMLHLLLSYTGQLDILTPGAWENCGTIFGRET